jgi:hypothetical protein
MGEKRNAYRVLVINSEGNRQIGRPRSKWDNIKTDLKGIKKGVRDLIDVAQDRDL